MSIRRFQPDELLNFYLEIRESISTAEFMRSPSHKKTQELWCAAHFGRAFQSHIGPCIIDIDERDAQTDADFAITFMGKSYPFQITEVQEPNRRRGDEYKDGDPSLRHDNWKLGSEFGAQWIRDAIIRKIEKHYADSASLHLLIYLNFPALSQNYISIHQAVADKINHFASIWLLNGNALCCINSPIEMSVPEGWLAIPQTLATY